MPYLTAMIAAPNLRSIRVAERLGFAPVRKDIVEGPVVIYAIDRSATRRPEA